MSFVDCRPMFLKQRYDNGYDSVSCDAVGNETCKRVSYLII